MANGPPRAGRNEASSIPMLNNPSRISVKVKAKMIVGPWYRFRKAATEDSGVVCNALVVGYIYKFRPSSDLGRFVSIYLGDVSITRAIAPSAEEGMGCGKRRY